MAGGLAWDPATCQVCGDAIAMVQAQAEDAYSHDGPKERFVACHSCRFPLCQACFTYERQEGSHACPHCKTAYPRLPGQGDPDLDDDRYSYTHPPSYMVHKPADVASVASDVMYQRHPQQHPGGQYPHQQRGQAAYDDNMSTVSGMAPHMAEPISPGGVSVSTAFTMSTALTAHGVGAPPLAPPAANSSLSAPFAGGPTFALSQEKHNSYEDEEARQPLCRKVPYDSNLINPYRMVIVIRLVVTGFFLHWRFLNVPEDAVILWALSLMCEIWFMCSWLLDQFPKWGPIKRETFKERLSIRYEPKDPDADASDNRLACVDFFVSTVDPTKEPPITTANTLLSVLALDYPPEKIAAYLQDDGGSMITFDCMAETAEFAKHWVPFCKKYKIEPRCPDTYFLQKLDILKDKVDTSFVADRRDIKKMYEEFKVRINALTARKPPADGWTMQDGTPWPGNNSRDHPGMIQVFLGPNGGADVSGKILPRMVYVSREKRPGYAHHKKAGAMNCLVRVSAILTNAPYILNLDCDHYINNASAVRDAMCVMMDDNVGPKTCFVQFPQRFDGIDPNDRYANHNTVFFDINMPGLDGVQGPVYVGTGCCFRRAALYGHVPPKKEEKPKGLLCGCISGCCTGLGACATSCCSCCSSRGGGRRRLFGRRSKAPAATSLLASSQSHDDPFAGGGGITPHPFALSDAEGGDEAAMHALAEYESKYGRSPVFVLSTFQEEGGSSALGPVQASGGSTLKEAIHVLSCGYEDQTAWGKEIGWIYGSVTEDILTGFKMHCRGWRSVYCVPRRVAFKGSAPINLSDRLQQVLRWALGSVEIFASRHCPIWYGWKVNKLKVLQRLAYINTAVYPFTSFPLIIYCMLPAVCLFTNRFIMPPIDAWAGLWFVALFLSILSTGLLEMRWSGVSMTEWWRNEQFWVIGGVSAHLFAVFQGTLKILAGIDTNFTVTAKQAGDEGGEFAELYLFKWTSLLIPPTFLVMINVLGIGSAMWTAINAGSQSWGPLFGRCFFSAWVIMHLYPFMKGLGGRSKRMPTLVIVWAVLLSSVFSLLWIRVDPWTESMAGPANCGVRC